MNPGGHSVFAVTHPLMYRYLPTYTSALQRTPCYQSTMLIVNTKKNCVSFLWWYYICSLTKICIAPTYKSVCHFQYQRLWGSLLSFYCRVATSLQSNCSCLFNQCTFTTYFLWKGDQINWSCTERTFSAVSTYLLLHKNRHSLLHIFKMAAIFKIAAMMTLPVFFTFLCFIDLFLA